MNQVPLSYERIKELWQEANIKTFNDWRDGVNKTFKQQLVEIIEKEHGIK